MTVLPDWRGALAVALLLAPAAGASADDALPSDVARALAGDDAGFARGTLDLAGARADP